MWCPTGPAMAWRQNLEQYFGTFDAFSLMLLNLALSGKENNFVHVKNPPVMNSNKNCHAKVLETLSEYRARSCNADTALWDVERCLHDQRTL